MTKITKHFHIKSAFAIALILLCSQPLMALTIFESMVKIENPQAILGINDASIDFDARSVDLTNNNIFGQLMPYTDGNIYTVSPFDEGGLYGTIIGESTAYNSQGWHDESVNRTSNVMGAVGIDDGQFREGSNSQYLGLGDEVSIERQDGDTDSWRLALHNSYAGRETIDIYANDLDGVNTTVGADPENMYRVRDSDFIDSFWGPNWSVEEEQMPYMIALYVESDIHTTITDASMSEDADDLHTNEYFVPFGDHDRFGADWNVDIKAGSWILCWEDKLNADRDTGWYADASDWDFNDLVIVLTPEASSVPEPSTVILFVVGMAGLLGVKIRMNGKNKA